MDSIKKSLSGIVACAAMLPSLAWAQGQSTAGVGYDVLVQQLGDGSRPLLDVVGSAVQFYQYQLNRYDANGLLLGNVMLPSYGRADLANYNHNLAIGADGVVYGSGTQANGKGLVITSVGLNGSITNTVFAGSNANPIDGTSIRSVVAGPSGGYYTSSTDAAYISAAGSRSSANLNSSQQVGYLNGNLVAALAQGRGGVNGLGAFNAATSSSLPDFSGMNGISTPIINLSNVSGFFSARLNAASQFDDTIYLSTDDVYSVGTVAGDGIYKYSRQSNGSWSFSGYVGGAQLHGIAGYVDGGQAVIFASNSSSIYKFTDTSGYNGTQAGSLSLIRTADANTVFEGIAVTPPVPEPQSLLLALAGGVFCVLAGRKGWRKG
jgi:hypothetical protein